jgi:hypothetical protein
MTLATSAALGNRLSVMLYGSDDSIPYWVVSLMTVRHLLAGCARHSAWNSIFTARTQHLILVYLRLPWLIECDHRQYRCQLRYDGASKLRH